MGNFLKYIFIAILALVFWSWSDKTTTSAVKEDITAAMTIEEAAFQTNISEAESELCLPRQVSFTNSQRVQSTVRRTTGTQRNTIEFTKSGKIVNADIQYFAQRKSIIIHSSHAEPAYRLLRLGKLII